MGNYIIAGLLVGSLLWWSKFLLCCIVLPKWIKTLIHNNPIGLLAMDTILMFLALHIINAAGATGLTVLFVLTFYGMWTMFMVIKYIVKKKALNIYHSYF